MSKSPTPGKHKKHARGAAHSAAKAPEAPEASGAGLVFGERHVLFLLVAVSALVYANSLGGEFLFDDADQIVNNEQIRSWWNVLRAFTSDVWSFTSGKVTNVVPPPYYRPLFTVYFTAGYKLFGLWEPGWHLLNLLVHTTATVLVYRVLRRMSASVAVAGFAALIFGVHPAHVESVSWVSGIPDPLAALFYLPALLWYVRHRQEGRGGRWLALSIAFFALSLLCKETAIVLPAVLFAWELAQGGGEGWAARARNAAARVAPYAAVAVLYLPLRYAVLGKFGWKHPYMAGVPDWAIWMTVPQVVVRYLQHLAAPFGLSLYYGTSFVKGASDVNFVLPAVILLALAALLWLFRRRLGAREWVALVMLFAPLLPVLNLKVFHQEYIVQDRYLYLPSVGFCYLVALLLSRLLERRRTLALALGALLLASYGAGTILQNRVWHDGVALWSRGVAHAPDIAPPHYNLGIALARHGDHAAAREEFLTAARLDPNVAAVHNNLALAQDKLGDEAGAVASLERALALDPGLHEARNNLGTLLFRRGELGRAREQFEQALRHDPSNASVRFNLARTLAASGDHAAAVPLFEGVLAASPNDSEARFQLALSYAAAGRRGQAESEIERALRDERTPERAAEMRARLAQMRGAAR
ncbi:MAG TPA: tetratricopeptide repeat protein [Pyrinomonadaceae bacterium]|jgi:Flp pilus assembly protein TadD